MSTATHDASGNQLTVGPYTFSYDAENHQVSESNTIGNPAATYSYDGNGNRVSRLAGAQTTVYVYDAFGALAAAYSNGGMGKPPCRTCYLTYDHFGTTRLITDSKANVIARHDYLPFGEEIPGGIADRSASQFGPGLDNINQKFTGQERDSETSLDFFQARYFGGALGRFLSPDPKNAGALLMNPQSWNAYAYVANNPLSATDPSGHNLDDPFGGSYDGSMGGGDGGWGGSGATRFLCGGPPTGGGSILDQQEAENEGQYVQVCSRRTPPSMSPSRRTRPLRTEILQPPPRLPRRTRMSLRLTPPNTGDPVYDTFGVAAAYLGIGWGQNVSVLAQQRGVSTSVQLTPIGGTAPYQLSDLTVDPNDVGTSDALSVLFHGSGNPSWYIGDSTDVTHIVDITTAPTDPNNLFQPGLQFHIDAYNPTASVVTFFQHQAAEVIPGFAAGNGTPTTVVCAVGFGCH